MAQDSVQIEGMMHLEFNALFRRTATGYIGFIEELPGANTQAATLDEARDSLREAALLVLEANRTLSEAALGKGDFIREPLTLSSP
jgi:predicted RNase H-like HicB family nuclease